MKEYIKSLLEQRASKVLYAYQAVNNRRVFRRLHKDIATQVYEKFYAKNDITVLSGPFKDLKYFNETVWGPITPKWLGSYENELNSIIEEIIENDYKNIIDIGCAEGYYAIGLAYRMPKVEVFGFDVDFISRGQAKKLARLNAVEDRVNISDYCTPEDISRLSTKNTLLICDIEGFERTLLEPETCQSLLSIDILVEIHEGFGEPSTLDLLKSRFCDSHIIQEVDMTNRVEWVNSMISTEEIFDDRELLLDAANEYRSDSQKWLWMKTKNLITQAEK